MLLISARRRGTTNDLYNERAGVNMPPHLLRALLLFSADPFCLLLSFPFFSLNFPPLFFFFLIFFFHCFKSPEGKNWKIDHKNVAIEEKESPFPPLSKTQISRRHHVKFICTLGGINLLEHEFPVLLLPFLVSTVRRYMAEYSSLSSWGNESPETPSRCTNYSTCTVINCRWLIVINSIGIHITM